MMLSGALGISEAHHDLIQHDVVQHFESRFLESLCKSPGLRAIALDHRSQPFSPQAEERRIDFDAARATRELRREVRRVAARRPGPAGIRR